MNYLESTLKYSKMTRLTNELVNDLMWNLGRPGAVNDLTLITQIEDITEMVGGVLVHSQP